MLFIFISDDPVHAAPTTSTRVFYISVGVCCAVIFLVAIILAVLHLHSMKRIELDDRYCTHLRKEEIKQLFVFAWELTHTHGTDAQWCRGRKGGQLSLGKGKVTLCGYCHCVSLVFMFKFVK